MGQALAHCVSYKMVLLLYFHCSFKISNHAKNLPVMVVVDKITNTIIILREKFVSKIIIVFACRFTTIFEVEIKRIKYI